MNFRYGGTLGKRDGLRQFVSDSGKLGQDSVIIKTGSRFDIITL